MTAAAAAPPPPAATAETKPQPNPGPPPPRPPHAFFQRFNSFVHDFQYYHQVYHQQQRQGGLSAAAQVVVRFGDLLYTIIWTIYLGLLIPAVAVPYLWIAYIYKVLSKIVVLVFVGIRDDRPVCPVDNVSTTK